jgi:flagellar basal body-associated protein FliL
MPAASDKTRRNSSRAIWILLLVAVCSVAAFLVYRNNRELFSRNGSPSAPVPAAPIRQVEKKADTAPIIKRKGTEQKAAAPLDPVVVLKSQQAAVDEPRTAAGRLHLRKSVLIPGVDCVILDKKDIRISLSLELFFIADSLQDEILMKREQLKVMVRKVLATKQFDDVKTGALKEEIKSAMNTLLERGAVEDIEFRAFRVEPMDTHTR